jgi:FAD synthetase
LIGQPNLSRGFFNQSTSMRSVIKKKSRLVFFLSFIFLGSTNYITSFTYHPTSLGFAFMSEKRRSLMKATNDPPPPVQDITRSRLTSNTSGSHCFTNWRTLPSKQEPQGSIHEMGYFNGDDSSGNVTFQMSHFCHGVVPLHDKDTTTTTTAAAAAADNITHRYTCQNAPWSLEAYKSALDLYDAFNKCTDSYIQPYIQDALHTLDHAYRLYGPESVVGSFNGGKDAVVILELIRAAHANYFRNLKMSQQDGSEGERVGVDIIRPRMIYFNNKLEFEQVYDFVRDTVNRYDLDMIAFEDGVGFSEGLGMLVENNYLQPVALSSNVSAQSGRLRLNVPHPMAFILGTRESDPNAGKQGTFAPSSSYMPPFMRVNPILEWTYGHVWHFLRVYKLPYCSLYDQGYTSLGTVQDTLPCPALKKVHVEDGAAVEYWPAYMLKDWQQERAGRLKKEKKKKYAKNESGSSSNEKIFERDVDTISNCSTVVSLPKYTAPPYHAREEVSAETIQSNTQQSTLEKSDESDVSSIGSDSTISQRTVGIIIIGDEILKGLTPDVNTHAAAAALNANNVPLSRVAIVSDDQDKIVAEIREMKDQVDVIITSGGVGPTHDDVTIKSVALALGCEMKFNDEMAELLRSKMNNGDSKDRQELTQAQVKMATLPECSKLKYLSNIEGDWPVLQCKNIFILPGVPQFFEKKVNHVAAYLSTELERTVAFKVVLSIDENNIVPILNTVVQNHPHVSFGSYPFVDHPDCKTVVTLEGKRKTLELDEIHGYTFEQDEIDVHVKVALSDLVSSLPDGSVLRVDNNNDLTFL